MERGACYEFDLMTWMNCEIGACARVVGGLVTRKLDELDERMYVRLKLQAVVGRDRLRGFRSCTYCTRQRVERMVTRRQRKDA
jgi:hypothetical protein